MDWSAIAGAVAPIAPKLGAVLGAGAGSAFGPLGSLVGGKVGSIAGTAIAAAFGVEATPEAVGKAIAEDSEAVKKLRILEETRGQEILAEAQIEVERLKAEAAQAESIGVTQREEIAAGVSWWHWRHLLGYVTMLWGIIMIAGTAKLMFFGGDIGAFTALVTASTPVFLALAALNGYIAHDTTARVKTAITGTNAPMGIAALMPGR